MSQPAAPKATRAGPSAEQMDLGDGWSHVVRGGRVVRDSAPVPTPAPSPQPVDKAPKVPLVTATVKKAKPEKAVPKTAPAPKKAAAKPTKAASTGARLVKAPNPVANPPSTSPLEDISDLTDSLPLEACVQLTRRLLASISSLPKGAARPRAVLKTVLLFVTKYRRHALGLVGAHPCASPAGMRCAWQEA
jgi:hypothetical protein